MTETKVEKLRNLLKTIQERRMPLSYTSLSTTQTTSERTSSAPAFPVSPTPVPQEIPASPVQTPPSSTNRQPEPITSAPIQKEEVAQVVASVAKTQTLTFASLIQRSISLKPR